MLNLINKEDIKVTDIVKNFDFNGRRTDYVEIEINHKRIEKLRRNIDKDTECVVAYIHFDKNTKELIDVFFYIRDDNNMDDIGVTLEKTEIENIKNVCLEQL